LLRGLQFGTGFVRDLSTHTPTRTLRAVGVASARARFLLAYKPSAKGAKDNGARRERPGREHALAPFSPGTRRELSPLIVAPSDREDARAAHLSIYRFIYLFIYLSIFCLKRNSKKKNRGCSFFASMKTRKKRMPKKKALGSIQKLSLLSLLSLLSFRLRGFGICFCVGVEITRADKATGTAARTPRSARLARLARLASLA
jgi:hypothetical protein